MIFVRLCNLMIDGHTPDTFKWLYLAQSKIFIVLYDKV